MQLSFEASRAGPVCCSAGQLSIHSHWDPCKEAERFVESALVGRKPSCFIISGPCLDYISPALRRRFPAALILSVQHDARFRERACAGADATWYPDQSESRESFLAAHLSEDAIGGVQVLAWPAASNSWPMESERTAHAIRSVLDRLAASSATLKTFGGQWIANACRNLLLMKGALTPEPIACPIVIAAAGPSLPFALDLLAPYRSSFLLFSVSSALAACRSAGMEPDLVVATDGGYWSRLHLYPLAARPAPLAMPLTALPSVSVADSGPFLVLMQGNFPEPELAPLVGGGLALPGHGTVTGSALHLAARLGSGALITAGMDLASWGLLSHCRPHGFDSLTRDSQTRLNSRETLIYAREAPSAGTPLPLSPWRTSRNLATYASALGAEAMLPLFVGRLFRLSPSPVELPGYAELTETMLGAFFGTQRKPRHFLHEIAIPPLAARRQGLAACIDEWRGLSRTAAMEIGGGHLPSSDRAKEILRAVDLPWWAAACRALAAGKDAQTAAANLEGKALAFLDALEERLA